MEDAEDRMNNEIAELNKKIQKMKNEIESKFNSVQETKEKAIKKTEILKRELVELK